jgi:alkyl hydroperoxide reductase subunit AhpC
MIELGQLEEKHEEFAKRKTRVVAVSIEDQEKARLTQKDFPHLVVVADADRGLSKAVDVIHPESAPDGRDTAAPTTLLVDGAGDVRWIFRAGRVFRRLSPEEVLASVDEHLK